MMKKLLSTVLSVCMLLTVVFALPVTAEDTAVPVISATEETFIELEKYTTFTTYGDKSYAFNGGSGKEAQTLNIPVTVEETDVYTMELVAAYADWLSTGKVCVNGVPVITLQSTAKTSMDTAESTYFDPKSDKANNFPAYQYVVPVALLAGQQTLTVTFEPRSETYGSSVAFAADYLKLTPGAEGEPVNPVIFANGDSYIELENYAKEVGVSKVERQGTHGGAYAYNGGGGSADQIFNIPVTVEKSGAYTLEYVGSNADYLSYGIVYVNDVAVISIQESQKVSMEPAEGTYFASDLFPAFKYTVPVTLYEGTQNISVKFYLRTSAGAAYAADYIKLTPVVSDTVISGTEETYIEFESFYKGIPKGENRSHDKMHNKSYLRADWYCSKFPQSASSLVVPFRVEKTGYYDLEFMINKMGNSYVSKYDIYIDEHKLLANDTNYSGTDSSEGNTFLDNNWPMYKYNSRVYLAEGEHLVYFLVTKAVSQNLITLAADYLKFTPAESYILSAEESTTVEAEALRTKGETQRIAILVENEANASGNAYIYTLSGGTTDNKYHIPFTVVKDGVYTFETVQAYANYMSSIEFYLDGSDSPIYTIPSSSSTLLEKQPFNADSNIDKIARLYSFNMNLSAGEHGITVVYKTRPSAQDTTAYAADYYRFTPVVDKAVLNADDKTVSVTANYEEPVSGTIIAAAYCGKEMVGMKSVKLTDVTSFVDTVSYTGTSAPDTVKVFVWDSLTNVIPFEIAKIITVK